MLEVCSAVINVVLNKAHSSTYKDASEALKRGCLFSLSGIGEWAMGDVGFDELRLVCI